MVVAGVSKTNRGDDVDGGAGGPLSSRLAHSELVARGPHRVAQVQLGTHALTHVQCSVDKEIFSSHAQPDD